MNGPVVIGLLILFTLAVIYADKWLDILMKPGTPMQWDETEKFQRQRDALKPTTPRFETEQALIEEMDEWTTARYYDFRPKPAKLKPMKRWTE